MSPIAIAIAIAIVLGAIVAVVLWNKKSEPVEGETSIPPTKPSAAEPSEPKSNLAPSILPPTDEQLEDEEGEPDDHERVLVTGVGMTDVGLKRTHNEDAYVCLPEHDLYAIADGMGAHAAGEVASKLTLEAILDAFERNKFLDPEAPDRPQNRKKRLTQVIERANQIVLTMSDEVEGYRGMGTTVVMVNFSLRKNFVFIAHVGDSRCYRIRGDEIKQITEDHTLGAVGIMGKTSSLLSRAVGIEPNIDVDVSVHRTETGDVYLLCSDGLSRMVSDDKILATVLANPDLNAVAKELIAEAKAAGGKDNVTTVLIRVEPPPDKVEPASDKFEKETLRP